MSDQQNPQQPQRPQLQIQLDEKAAEGAYANLTLVNHTETEFVFDFIYVQPHQPQGKLRSRIISSPKHAKRLLGALQENVAKFEALHGTIDLTPPGQRGVH